MKFTEKLKLLAIPAIITNSMLTSVATAQASLPRGFTQTCTDVELQAGTLFATCRTIDGREQRSSIDLNRYIANKNGDLMWSRGGNFAATSSNCETDTMTPYGSNTLSYLFCSGKTPLALDEHIENVDGRLRYYE